MRITLITIEGTSTLESFAMPTLALNPEGTLLDPLPCLRASLAYTVLLVTGQAPDRARLDAAVRFPPSASLERLLGRPADDEQVKEASLHCAGHFLDHIASQATAYAGAREAITVLRERGWRVIGLVDQPWVLSALGRLGIVLDSLVDARGRACPRGRTALLYETLAATRREDACWLTDCPPELALTASTLPVAPRFAAYGRFGGRPTALHTPALACAGELVTLAL